MKLKSLITLAPLMLSALSPAHAGYVLYDFENDWQFEDWEYSHPEVQSVQASELFAVSGETSARFYAAALPVAPEFESRV